MVGQNTLGRASSFARKTLGSLKRDTRASVLPIMAAGLIPTMAMIGAGVDFGRVYLAQSKLQGAVDAGALAAVRARQVSGVTNSQAEEVGKDYISANFPAGYLDANLGQEVVEVTEVSDVVTADVTASGTIRTALLRLVGLETLTFSAQAQAQASDTLPTAVEALLVLDNTGSMRGRRMSDLKTAAKNFVNTIYGEKDTRSGFGVGILPYNTMVNVGRLVRMAESTIGRELVADYPDFTDEPVTDPMAWKGCLFADPTIRGISSDIYEVDANAFDIDDTMPGEPIDGMGAIMPVHQPFIYPPIYVDSFQDVYNQYEIPGDHIGIWAIPTVKEAMQRRFGEICIDKVDGQPLPCANEDARVDFNQIPEDDRDDFRPARYYSHHSGESQSASPNNIWGASPNYQCPAEALPINYSATKTSLKAYIDDENYALMPGTGTFHNAAMTWAYRMMSRRDVFPRARPTDIPTKRVVIFMTDGNFDSRDDGRTPSGGGGKVLDTAYTAYKTYEDRIMISNTSKDDTIDALELRFSKTCEAMKEDGIEIYTIAFELNNNARGDRTRDMFRQCATDRNTHFFAAANGAQLNDAFVTIASELINLRLTR